MPSLKQIRRRIASVTSTQQITKAMKMVAAAKLSVKKGLLAASSAVRIENLLAQLKLPTKLDADPEAVMDAIKKDKKREGEKINFILLPSSLIFTTGHIFYYRRFS